MPVKPDRGERSLGGKSDRDLIKYGREIAMTQRALALELGCSERMLSMVVSQGQSLSAETRRRLIEFIRRGGRITFSDAPRLTGRQPRPVPTGGAMHFKLTDEEYTSFQRFAEGKFMAALSEAVTNYVGAHADGLPSPPPLPEDGLVDVRVRIDVDALVALNVAVRATGDTILRLRNLHIRAALLEWVAKKSHPKERAHGQTREADRGRRKR